MFTGDSYGRMLAALMPKGRAWSTDQSSFLGRLLRGIAEEMARLDARAENLVEEADPGTALELLAEWERIAGLPDPCFGPPTNIPERQTVLVSRLTGLGGQSRAYFIGLAESLGYRVSIEEFRPFRCGDRIARPVYGEDWTAAWRVNILPTDWEPNDRFVLAQFRCGDKCGKKLRGWGAIKLECLIRRHQPAHGVLIFAYRPDPDPLFWMDFTT